MIVQKDDEWFLATDTGITHPRYRSPIEFRFRCHISGGYIILTPNRTEPELDDEIIVTMNQPDEQERINAASPEALAELALADVVEFYDEEYDWRRGLSLVCDSD